MRLTRRERECQGVGVDIFKIMPWMDSLRPLYVGQLADAFACVLPMASKSILDCMLFLVSSLILIHRAVCILPI